MAKQTRTERLASRRNTTQPAPAPEPEATEQEAAEQSDDEQAADAPEDSGVDDEQPQDDGADDAAAPEGETKEERKLRKLREHSKFLRSLTPRERVVYSLTSAKDRLRTVIAGLDVWPLADDDRALPIAALDALINAVNGVPEADVPIPLAARRSSDIDAGEQVTLTPRAARHFASYWVPGAVLTVVDVEGPSAGLVAARGRMKGTVIAVPVANLLPVDPERRQAILDRRAKIAAKAKERRENAAQPAA